MFHVEHAQAARKDKAWCGAMITGPRIVGIENFLYHSEQEGTGPVCKKCLEAMLTLFGVAIRKTNAKG